MTSQSYEYPHLHYARRLTRTVTMMGNTILIADNVRCRKDLSIHLQIPSILNKVEMLLLFAGTSPQHIYHMSLELGLLPEEGAIASEITDFWLRRYCNESLDVQYVMKNEVMLSYSIAATRQKK